MALHEEFYASAKSERSAILDSYSNQLSKRDEALDRRKHLLKKREKELNEKLEKCKEHGREIEMMRGAIYQEKSAFLQAAEKREEELKEIEANQRAVAANLTERMAIVNDLLETSKKTAAELRDKREELKRVNEQLIYMHSTLRTARHTMENLKSKSEQASVRERKCSEIVVSLDNRKTELDSLQVRLTTLETDLTQRERNMADRLSEAAVVLPLKRVLPDLRRMANEYNDFRQNLIGNDGNSADPVSVDERLTLEEQVDLLQRFFKDFRKHARTVAVREHSCSMKEDALAERERNLAHVESNISGREKKVRDAERRLSVRSKDVELQMNEAKAMLQRAEDSTRRIAQKEERVYSRESAVQERETFLKEKESHLSRQRKVLVAQEKSLKRAGEALKSHESTIANEALQVEEIRTRLQSLEDDINAREALLKTKEVELSVREAAAAVKARQPLREIPRIPARVAEAPMVPEAPTSPEALTEEATALTGAGATVPSLNIAGASDVHLVSQISERHERSSVAASDNNGGEADQPPDIEVDAQNPGSAMPSTVRKQLTFGFTPSNLEEGVNQDQAGPPNLEVGSDRSRGSDADSERAAEQLHDELKAARGLWIEKVNRLDTVVSSMSADLTTTGTQLLPVIRNVREELQRIRAQAQEEPHENNSPASEAFAMEQQRHRDWALSMTAQLNTIKEVQAGLLLAFNRVLPNTARRDRDPFLGRRQEMSDDPQIGHLQPLRVEDTDLENVDSNSGGRSSGDTNTDEMLRKLAPARPRRKHRKGSRRRKPQSTETSITDNSNEHKQYNVTVPGWSNSQPLTRLPLTPLGTSDQIDALRRELGLDPVSR